MLSACKFGQLCVDGRVGKQCSICSLIIERGDPVYKATTMHWICGAGRAKQLAYDRKDEKDFMFIIIILMFCNNYFVYLVCLFYFCLHLLFDILVFY